MAIYNDKSLSQIINMLDIVDREKDFVVPRAVIQRRQYLGIKAIEKVFDLTQTHWHKEAHHLHWNGLSLLAVDGLAWRTPDTPENNKKFSK